MADTIMRGVGVYQKVGIEARPKIIYGGAIAAMMERAYGFVGCKFILVFISRSIVNRIFIVELRTEMAFGV
ncbi:MAG: hypothetical protein AAGB31_00915 [Bdellovibrio sp.]